MSDYFVYPILIVVSIAAWHLIGAFIKIRVMKSEQNFVTREQVDSMVGKLNTDITALIGQHLSNIKDMCTRCPNSSAVNALSKVVESLSHTASVLDDRQRDLRQKDLPHNYVQKNDFKFAIDELKDQTQKSFDDFRVDLNAVFGRINDLTSQFIDVLGDLAKKNHEKK